MPNVIKYTTGSTPIGCLRKGNMSIGNNNADYGLTFFNGIDPPAGGYTVYLNKPSGGPSIYCPANNSQLISLTNSISGSNYTTVNQCFSYYDSQTDKICVNQNYPTDFPYIVLDGLYMFYDAGVTSSYPGTGTTWSDVNGLRTPTNGTLTNGPTYSSTTGGILNFDGSNDYISVTSGQGIDIGVNFSIQTWVKVNRWGGGPNWNRAGIVSNSYTYSNGTGFWLACTSQASAAQGFIPTVGLENFFLSMGADQYCVAPTPGSLAAYRNSWFNIGVSVNGTGLMKCYINGSEVSSYACQTNGPSSYSYNSSAFSLGNRNNNEEYLDGSMANFLMYNRTITGSEFLQNYNAQKSRFGY